MRKMDQLHGLLYCRYLLIRARWRRNSQANQYMPFDHELEIRIAKAMASGVLMEDWVAQEVASGYMESKSLRMMWVRTAAVITTYLMRVKEVDYQVEEDVGDGTSIKLEF